ncbi:alpha/beta fold hydrolase [Paragemmobacter ruber]|uniref:Alpha/beta fold hydrolase n=1 Tax=Paragemmobacter ruber TaxID=1985673 RepID=A0ABW9Y7S5_9RHOB|nr:alpha/beta hydrolase [Rhodobacter ruber]NBE08631.1 alpha/beta fold hydrolase [Rhodobacter ruber]
MRFPKLALSLIVAATAIGGCAVLTDRRADERERQAEADYPPTGQVLSVAGRRVHAHVQGSGPDLVLIHGASGNTRDFTFALVDRLAQDYRVIAFDRPGLGWTDDLGEAGVSPFAQAELLRAAADQLGVRRPIVLGHSYGGSVAMAWGLSDTPDVSALVILSGATMPWPGGLGPYYAVTGTRLGGATVVPVITAFVPPARAAQVVDGIFAPDAAPVGYADYIGVGLSMRRQSLRANGRQVWGLKPYVMQMAEAYPRLSLPVEIVHGTADTTVPADIHAIPLSRLLPNAQLTLLPDVAHMPHHTHPDAVIAAIHRAAARAGLR